jgi:protein-tyrosine phosphatase
MPVRVLFVCMGNICRSPTAHGVFERLVRDAGLSEHVEIDSAGTHAYHVGEPPDPRAQSTALTRGYDLSAQRARRVRVEDFESFDFVVAMDAENLADLAAICPGEHREKLTLFMHYAGHLGEDEVPDPYYGGRQGFERVLDLVEAAAHGLLEQVRGRLKAPEGASS